MDDIDAHICLYIDNIEMHLDIRNDSGEPIFEVITDAFTAAIEKLKEEISANLGPASVERLH